MNPNLDPDEWLRRNGTFWCPRLRLRAKAGFCEVLRRRPALKFHMNKSHIFTDWGGDDRPLRPAACEGCGGPERGGNLVERRARKIPEVHRHQVPEPPAPSEIRRLRTRLGLTQGQLARKLGVSQQLVSVWERGRIKVRGEYIPKLLKPEKRV